MGWVCPLLAARVTGGLRVALARAARCAAVGAHHSLKAALGRLGWDVWVAGALAALHTSGNMSTSEKKKMVYQVPVATSRPRRQSCARYPMITSAEIASALFAGVFSGAFVWVLGRSASVLIQAFAAMANVSPNSVD
jgi:hypothetical protein